MIGLKTQAVTVDVGVGNMRINRHFKLELGRRLNLLTLEVGNRFADHAQIKVKANSLDVPRLLSPEQVASATNLKVFHGNLHARAELVIGRDGC